MTDPKTKSTNQLLEIFTRSALEHFDTYITGNVKKSNKLYSVIDAVARRLRDQPGDEHIRLTGLLRHENPHVRLQAAKYFNPVAPKDARSCLEAIRAARLPDQSLDAGMTIRGLDEDPYCLDL